MDSPPAAVILVCGASGAGKSRASTALSARYGIPVSPADDIVTALMRLLPSELHPVLEFWETRPETLGWEPGRVADHHAQVAEVLRPGFEAVIADYLAWNRPVILEGDYLTPRLAEVDPARVVAVVIDEPDVEQFVANYLDREPAAGEQRHRAQVSAIIGRRLVAEARQAGGVVVPARPWEGELERLDAALRARAGRG